MHIALGVVVDEDSVTAALVDVDLPQLGPVDERTTRLGDGDVGDAVAAAIGVMSLRAKRADLGVHRTAVALGDPSRWHSVSRALEHHLLADVALVDLDSLSSVDPDGRYGAPVDAALWADRGATVAAPVLIPDAPDAPPPASPRRRGMAVVGAGVAAALIAASVTVWAATTAPRVVSEPAPGAVESATSDGSNGTDGTAVPPTPGVATPPSSAPAPSSSPEEGSADAGVGEPRLAVPPPAGSQAARPDAPSVPRPQSGGGSPSSGSGTSSGGGSSSGGTSGGGGASGGGTSGGGTAGGGGGTGTPGTGSPGTGGGTPSTGGGSTTVDPPVVTAEPTDTESSTPNEPEPDPGPNDASIDGE
ncbi:hypothetical protein HQ602_14045 [Rhodococcus kroppenstedtii]|uniref:hypothetical protein n=1 Tax=Rhodococcoides kroppenstedtii TaxID=293050 RepID=UPI001C9AD530|nr:hypothetical protein [Rhodococcus kroppenstedtii]MBY6437504.1 hypothetical protein [Rhodococcus kroppenstedtii]